MSLVSIPRKVSIDLEGAPRVGAQWYFYEAGTANAIPTYTTADLDVEHPIPVPSSDDGYFPAIHIDPTLYPTHKQVMLDANGLTIFTEDDIPTEFSTLRTELADDTAGSDGSRLIGYRRDATGAVARTLYAKVSDTVSVQDFGAEGDGATNDTTAFQDAVDESLDVYVPAGDYLIDTVTMRSGLRIHGDGPSSILRQNTITDGSYGTLYANSGAAGSTVDDLVIENLQILGNVAGLSFSQFQHLISLNGVRRVTIRNCLIKGFRGDGVYLGSGVVAGHERHNSHVKIVDCIFDGVNNDNRNGVSVIDGNDVLISGNTFVNCTRSNMPGAVDIEPDSYTFHVVRNIRVLGNHFKDCGGNVANISLVLIGTVFTTQPETFIFNNNTFDGTANGFVVNNSVASYARPLDVQFCNNTGKVADPWQVFTYADGITISNNQLRFTGDPVFGNSNTDIVKKLIVSHNILTGDGSTTGMVIRSGSHITIDHNTFDALNGYAILLGGAGATLDKVGILGNDIVSAAIIGVQFGGGTVTDLRVTDNEFAAGTAFFGTIPADTRIRNNKGYVSENGGVTSAIATAATVTHGCATTPTNVSVTALDTGPTDIFVSAIGATTFTVNYGGGGTHVFSWEAKTTYHYQQ